MFQKPRQIHHIHGPTSCGPLIYSSQGPNTTNVTMTNVPSKIVQILNFSSVTPPIQNPKPPPTITSCKYRLLNTVFFTTPHILTVRTTLLMDDDPLRIKDLAVSYDYLMYKIHDHIALLLETTFSLVESKQRLIEQDYFQQQLQLDKNIADAQALLDQCDDLELQFMKLDQLYLFVDDFKDRVARLEKEFDAL